MTTTLDFKKIFEQEYQRMKNEPNSYLAYYNYLNGFAKDPIEFKALNNSWCGLDELIHEYYRSDYRRLSKNGVRQEIKDNAKYIKTLAKEYKNKFGFDKKKINEEQFKVDILFGYAKAAFEKSQHFDGYTKNYEDNTIECLKQMGYDI
jgi:hypothetical protein